MKLNTLKKSQTGITLVEIMISLLLGAFLTGGIFQIFFGTKQTYLIQDALSEVQENGRFSMDFIARDMRMADFWGCVKSAEIESKLNPNAVFDGFADGLSGQDNDNDGNDGDADNDENTNGIWDGTDSITLRGALPTIAFLVEQPTTVSANIHITNDSGLVDDDIVLLSDCRSGDIFQITTLNPSDAAKDVAVHNTGASMNASQKLEIGLEADNTGGPQANRYGTDAQIYKLAFIEYSIRQGANGQPALFKGMNGETPLELVEGVEDMQILYGEDSDVVPDFTANYYVDAATVVDFDRVVSVRITLLLHTLKDNVASRPLQYNYNGSNTTPTDRRLRRVYTTTIALRNRI